MGSEANFTIYDYLILATVFGISISIGLYHSSSVKSIFKKCRNKKTQSIEVKEEKADELQDEIHFKETKLNEYFIGNRQMSTLPVALSILATVFSTNTIIGTPAEVYQYGIQIIMMSLAIGPAAIISGYLFLPLIRRLKVITIYEYYQTRFNNSLVRLVGASVYLLHNSLWMGSVIFGSATSLSTVMKVNVHVLIVVVSVITVVYTALGGIKGVIWADVFQLGFMISGIAFIIIKGSYDIGGISEVWKRSNTGGRLNFFDFSLNPFIRQTFWSILFGNFLRWIMQYITDQSVLQRFSSTKSIKSAQYALLINIPASIFIVCSTSFIGLIIYATYAQCDPLKDPTSGIKNPNQLFAYYVNNKFSSMPGVSGFVQGTLMAAALSTLSSILNSQSAIIWRNILQQFEYFRSFDDASSLRVTKVLVIICGCLGVLFATMLSFSQGNLVQLGFIIQNAISPPLLLLLFLGTCFHFVNTTGAIAGAITTLGIGIWLMIGSVITNPKYPKLFTSTDCYNSTNLFNQTMFFNNTSGVATNFYGFNKIYSLSFNLFSYVSLIAGIIVGLVVSLLTGGSKSKTPSAKEKEINLILLNKT